MSPNIELDSCLSVSIFGYTIISSTEFIHKIVYCSKKQKSIAQMGSAKEVVQQQEQK
jgi:hypothetical protein